MSEDRTNKASYSELSTLAECEEKWLLRYGSAEYVSSADSAAMQKGTLVHAGVAGLMRGALWEEIVEEMETIAEERGAEAKTVDDALWLVERYLAHYSELMANVVVEHAEAKLEAKVPGTDLTVYGYVDEVWIIDGKRWMVERKTMGDWARLDLVTVDPQLTLYYWLAQQNGLQPYGILFDAIRTYRWALDKPTQKQVIEDEEAAEARGERLARWRQPDFMALPEMHDLTPAKRKQAWARGAVDLHPGVETHSPSESFEQLWIDRNELQVAAGLQWATDIVERREAVRARQRGIRNIGPFCKRCVVKDDCFDGLAFPEPTIELLP